MDFFNNSNLEPKCNRANCFAYKEGKCIALSNNRFKRECPFFKDKHAKAEEDARCKVRADKFEKERKKKLELERAKAKEALNVVLQKE